MNAAVFVDFEDLHRGLGTEVRETGEANTDSRVRDVSLAVLDGLLARLRDGGHTMVVGRSYAAFDAYPGAEVAHDLALLGLDPQYVLVGHSGRNSADVQLTFDVARVLFRRDDIEMIVVASGDRDFLPLARQVLEEGRELRVVSIARTTSGDLRERVGDNRFWDVLELAAEGGDRRHRRRTLEPLRPQREREPAEAGPKSTEPESSPNEPEIPTPVGTAAPAACHDGGAAVVVGHIPVTWDTPATAADHELRLEHCLELMMKSRVRHGSREVWLSPFLKGPMSQYFADIVHPERRALINELRARGVIRVEERDNLYADHPYSVIVIADDHPMARSVAARLRAS